MLDCFGSRTTQFLASFDIIITMCVKFGVISLQIRTHYLELLYRIASSTDYRSHNHRQKEITVVLNRIAQEEGEESQRDHDVIKKIWIDHSGCFDEITDL